MSISAISSATSASRAAMLACDPALQTSELEKTKSADASRDPASIKKAASQFEAIILRQLLAPALEPMMSGGLGGMKDAGGGIYGYMLTDTMAGSLAQGGGFGLARMLEKQFSPPAPAADISPDGLTVGHPQLRPLKLP